MNIELPLYAQESPSTCALACLRMVLAARGTYLEERALAAETLMAPGGTPIEDLQRLAHRFGVPARIEHAALDQLRMILAQGKLSIVYVNRAVFQLRSLGNLHVAITEPKLHAVIPTKITSRFVTFHDPLPPRIARRSIRRFDRAQSFVQHAALVCELR